MTMSPSPSPIELSLLCIEETLSPLYSGSLDPSEPQCHSVYEFGKITYACLFLAGLSQCSQGSTVCYLCLVSFLCREECYAPLCVCPLSLDQQCLVALWLLWTGGVDNSINPRLHFFGSVLSLHCILINDFYLSLSRFANSYIYLVEIYL